MQTAVIARLLEDICLSVRPSVRHIPVFCPDDVRSCGIQLLGRTILLVSGEVKFTWIFAGDHPQRSVKVRHSHVDSENLTNNLP